MKRILFILLMSNSFLFQYTHPMTTDDIYRELGLPTDIQEEKGSIEFLDGEPNIPSDDEGLGGMCSIL